ncbi:helicase associated domain-containing protein [Kitasatospora sp. NPDC052896]|uniref:helicase associated domain-containing protein n=1 Tax=Kitasatospora sp. NPDC052896 TaxID=3364061 RepID=UPI0037C9D91A
MQQHLAVLAVFVEREGHPRVPADARGRGTYLSARLKNQQATAVKLTHGQLARLTEDGVERA